MASRSASALRAGILQKIHQGRLLAHSGNSHFSRSRSEADIERLQKAELSSSQSGAIATSIDRINNDGDLPLGNTLGTDAQSAQGWDQAKFQINAVATKP
jgi:hypothetical protein